MEKGIRDFLCSKGYELDENLSNTPQRVKRALEQGILSKEEAKKRALNHLVFFPSNYEGMVIVKNIRAVSFCPHHLMPIRYSISVAYVPSGRVAGLSKIYKFVRELCKGLFLQEDLTEELSTLLYEGLGAKGVMVVVEGHHGCIEFRSIAEDSCVITSSVRGCFGELACREEALRLLG